MEQWILFDKDGTLIEMDKSWIDSGIQLIEDAIVHFNIQEASDIYETLGIENHSFKKNSIMDSGTVEDMAHVLNDYVSTDTTTWLQQHSQKLMKARVPNVQLFADTRKTLDKLKARGYKLGIITSDTRQGVDHFFDVTGVAHYFDIVLSTDGSGIEKPDPRVFEPFFERFSVNRENVTIVGDSRNDILSGKNAKLGRTIGVLTGVGDKKSLEEADVVLTHLSELQV